MLYGLVIGMLYGLVMNKEDLFKEHAAIVELNTEKNYNFNTNIINVNPNNECSVILPDAIKRFITKGNKFETSNSYYFVREYLELDDDESALLYFNFLT